MRPLGQNVGSRVPPSSISPPGRLAAADAPTGGSGSDWFGYPSVAPTADLSQPPSLADESPWISADVWADLVPNEAPQRQRARAKDVGDRVRSRGTRSNVPRGLANSSGWDRREHASPGRDVVHRFESV